MSVEEISLYISVDGEKGKYEVLDNIGRRALCDEKDYVFLAERFGYVSERIFCGNPPSWRNASFITRLKLEKCALPERTRKNLLEIIDFHNREADIFEGITSF